MSDLKITNLYKRYGQVEILKDVNLDIRSGEFIVFVGPSGCGKSTLLRCISGLETITSRSTDGSSTTSPRASAASPWCSRATRSTRT
jgi:ABC-type Fe3+/spermidine/putrescine transport system ATPase subunit